MKLTRRQLRKLILEYSETEQTYFGAGITALIKHPNKIYKEDEFGNQVLNDELLKKVGKRKGGGFYRDTYFIDDNENLLLKISNRNDDPSKDAGIDYATQAEMTNQYEIDFFNKYPDFFPKVYIHEREPDGTTRLSMPRWFVVEKVKVIESIEEMNEKIVETFPSIAAAYNYLTLWLDIKSALLYEGIPSVFEADKEKLRLREDKENWIQLLFFTAILKNFKSGTLFERLMNLNVWKAKNMTFDQKISYIDNKIMRIIEKIVLSDRKILEFHRLLTDLNNVEDSTFEFNEISPGNVGTDLNGEGFKLIDISLFDK